MTPAKLNQETFLTNTPNKQQIAALSSHWLRLPSSNFRRLFGTSHRRCASDHGPSTRANLIRKAPPQANKEVLRRTRSEGHSLLNLKDFMLRSSLEIEGYSHPAQENGYKAEHHALDDYISLRPCENDNWTEVVILEKCSMPRPEKLPAPLASLGARPISPLKKFFAGIALDTIQEVEDSKLSQLSFVDHKRSYSCGNIGSINEKLQSLRSFELAEIPSPKEHRPLQNIPRKGTPAKPYAQATGYLSYKPRFAHDSSPSSGSTDSSSDPEDSYPHHVPRPRTPLNFLNHEWDSSRMDARTVEDRNSIKIVSIDSATEQGAALAHLPRVDPSQPRSSPYLPCHTLTKESQNLIDFIRPSTPDSTLYTLADRASSPISANEEYEMSHFKSNLDSPTANQPPTDITSGRKQHSKLPKYSQDLSVGQLTKNQRRIGGSGDCLGFKIGSSNSIRKREKFSSHGGSEINRIIESRPETPETVMLGLIRLMDTADDHV